MRTDFHPLTVSRVDPLTDDSAAVTFAVPDDVATDFAFAPGPVAHGPARRRPPVVLDLRAGRAARRASACARCPAARCPAGWCTTYAPATCSRCRRRAGRSRPTSPHRGHHVLIAAGSGITPMLSIAASLLARPRRHDRHAAVRQPAHRLGDVRRRGGRPQGRPPRPDAGGPRAVARAARGRTVQRSPRRRQAARAAARDGRRRRRSTTGGCADRSAWSTTRSTCSPNSVSRVGRIHRELFYVGDDPPDEIAPRRRTGRSGRRGHGDPRRPQHHHRRATRHPDPRRRPAGPPRSARSPARAACAAPAAPAWSSGEVTMRRNYALEEHELDAGYVLTCQALPMSDEVTVDYDA